MTRCAYALWRVCRSLVCRSLRHGRRRPMARERGGRFDCLIGSPQPPTTGCGLLAARGRNPPLDLMHGVCLYRYFALLLSYFCRTSTAILTAEAMGKRAAASTTCHSDARKTNDVLRRHCVATSKGNQLRKNHCRREFDGQISSCQVKTSTLQPKGLKGACQAPSGPLQASALLFEIWSTEHSGLRYPA